MRVAVQAVLLAGLLAVCSLICAMDCSAQPGHPVPPCHSHHGAQVCGHALPDADIAVAAHWSPGLTMIAALPIQCGAPGVSSMLRAAVFQTSPPDFAPPLPGVLRI